MIGVTSFSQEGYEKYGKNFLKHAHHFPGKIVVYTESPLEISNEQIEERNLFTIEGIANFLHNIKSVPMCHGQTDRGYNYNFDIWKFCRKMFCQYDMFQGGGKVFWLDGDLEFKKDIPVEFLENLFDGNPLIYLGREGFYTETGFVGFDTEHKDFENFHRRYIEVLKTGQVLKLKGWHDCYCFDWAKEDLGRNLTPQWKKGDSLQVIKSSPLSEYMTHHKGNRKDAIKS